MKYLHSISLVQFKNYEFQSFDFHQKCVAIIGKNGSGKTNLLDAIYYICFTKSYFNKKEKNNILFDKEGFRISAQFIMEAQKNVVTCVYKENKKTFSLNATSYTKISEHIGFQTAVIIAPDDISIINGYSEDRRKFYDGLLSQMDAHYLHQLLEYQKILTQKNTYLKSAYPASRELLQIYNDQLLHSGQYIIDKRITFSEQFTPLVQDMYQKISQQSECISINHDTSSPLKDWAALQLQIMDQEIYQKRTLLGPHIDDWTFEIKDLPIKSHGSQGQKKSFLLALKLAQITLLNQHGFTPILLLDDIFEKLDKSRLHSFFELIANLDISQVFLTHTDDHLIREVVEKHFPDIDIIELKN